VKKNILRIFLFILFVSTILIASVLLTRLKMEYNSEGNYFDENTLVVYKKQAIIVYGIITLLLLFFIFIVANILRRIGNKF
jgi:hypothetical protein